MQSDSVSIARDRRMAFSRMRERMTSCSVGLPTSNDGEAIGLSSVVMVKIPSNLRSSDGLVTSAEICTHILAGGQKVPSLMDCIPLTLSFQVIL